MIQHGLLGERSVEPSAVSAFVLMSVMYAVLQSIEQLLRTRVMLQNRLVVKRLILERILYSEIGSLQSRYLEIFGEEVRTEQLEVHVFNDITETLQLFNSTIPSIVRGAYSFIFQAWDLYQAKLNIDILAILRPTLVGAIGNNRICVYKAFISV